MKKIKLVGLYPSTINQITVGGLASLLLCSLIPPTSAQIIPDTTLPQNSTVTVDGNSFNIQGGTTAGTNLFHSFQEFSLPGGTQAVFANPSGSQNIITRITGGSPSRIDGIIAAGGSANLFFLNPQGIIFGPGAALNIGGSFFATTADAITFADGTSYSASSSSNQGTVPLLTVTVPELLEFRSNPAPIINQSRFTSGEGQIFGLAVNPTQTLALIGGDISLESGGLTALQGNIELVSLNGGNWHLNSEKPGFSSENPSYQSEISLRNPVSSSALGGNIGLSGGSVVNASGLGGGRIQLFGGNINLTEGSRIVADTFGDFDGGGININAQNFTLQNRAFVSSSTFGTGAAGNLTIAADTVNIRGTEPTVILNELVLSLFNPIGLRDGLYAFSAGAGKAGNLTIEANRVNFGNGAAMLTSALATGPGGEMRVNASESLTVDSGSIMLTGTVGTGDAGSLTLSAGSLQVFDGSLISTTPNATSSGRGGDLTINADTVTLGLVPAGSVVPGGLFSTTLGAGDAGNLTVTARQLEVSGGAQISAASAGAGRGGDLVVNADRVELRGVSPDGRFLSGLFVSSSLLTVTGLVGTGAGAGNLAVTADVVSVRDGAQISAATGGEGAAGSLKIRAAERVLVSGFANNVDAGVERVSFGVVGDGIVPSAIESNTRGSGIAGDLTIETESLVVRDGAEIGVRGTGAGGAGNLQISASAISLESEGALSAATVAGAGGNISLVSPDIRLRGGSRISTNAGNANGGNISLETDTLVALENSDITANAEAGRGGRVSITATGIFGTQFRNFQTPDSDITATSELGPQFSGAVEINTPDVDPGSGVVFLPVTPLDAAASISRDVCAAGAGSSFYVTGSGGLPPNPEDPLNPDVLWSDNRFLAQEEIKPRNEISGQFQGEKIVEATGWVVGEKGDVILVAAPVPPHPVLPLKPQACQ